MRTRTYAHTHAQHTTHYTHNTLTHTQHTHTHTQHTHTLPLPHQFILIEERDEGVRDDLVEAIHETSDLRTNCLRHSHLCHQLHIFMLCIHVCWVCVCVCGMCGMCGVYGVKYVYMHKTENGTSEQKDSCHTVPTVVIRYLVVISDSDARPAFFQLNHLRGAKHVGFHREGESEVEGINLMVQQPQEVVGVLRVY